ncbi:MAG TPA: hypothetical protein DIC22_07220 [Chitinophagaceae bacterium]|nr:hypothetical protein [Chitinophagaceae bacterium]
MENGCIKQVANFLLPLYRLLELYPGKIYISTVLKSGRLPRGRAINKWITSQLFVYSVFV